MAVRRCWKCKTVGCKEESHVWRNVHGTPCEKCGEVDWDVNGRCKACTDARAEQVRMKRANSAEGRFRRRATNQRAFRARDVGQRAVRRGRETIMLHGTAMYYEYRILWWALGVECPLLASDFKRVMDDLGEDVRKTLDWVNFAPYLVRIDNTKPMLADNVRIEVRRLTEPYEDIAEMPEGWV